MAERVAFAVAAGLTIFATAFFVLSLFGALNRVATTVVAMIGVIAAVTELRKSRIVMRPPSLRHWPAIVTVGACFGLCLYPPLAFDETTYHLPAIAAFARSGEMGFLTNLRFPVFPWADEALRVPLYLWGGAIATHLLSLIAIVAILLLVAAATRCTDDRARSVSAALFISSPLVIYLSAVAYVECTVALFVTAALVALDRWATTRRAAFLFWAGAFAALTASIKYLGLFWIAVVAVLALIGARPGERIRSIGIVVAGCLVAVPWYLRICFFTGNPAFPFLPSIFGATVWTFPPFYEPFTIRESIVAFLRIPWDTLFARERAGLHPPISPWFIACAPFVIARLRRDARLAIATAICLAFAVIYVLVRPRDARYLTAILPLASIMAGTAICPVISRIRSRAAVATLCILAVLPGFAYAAYRLHRYGPVPSDAVMRDAFLSARVPGYRGLTFLSRISHRGETAYACGGENLVAYFDGHLIGDFVGGSRYDLVLTAAPAEVARRLDDLGVRQVIVVTSRCPVNVFESSPFYRRVYSDDATIVYARDNPRA